MKPPFNKNLNAEAALTVRLDYIIELLERLASRPVPYPADDRDPTILRRDA